MFEKYTEKARQVVVAASEEARRLGHSECDDHHLLLGLLAGGEDTLASIVLAEFGLGLTAARVRVEQLVASGVVPTGQIPFTPRAKKILDLSLREALSLGHNYIGTEHLLFGLVRVNEGISRVILEEEDAFPDDVRNRTIRLLSGRQEPGRPSRHPRRCPHALTLYGATFHCHGVVGHRGDHAEHGDGWRMAWEVE